MIMLVVFIVIAAAYCVYASRADARDRAEAERRL